MAARVLRLIPGVRRRRRCANCQVIEQRVERLEDFVTALLASSVVSCPRLTGRALGCADEYGLRARVEAELAKGRELMPSGIPRIGRRDLYPQQPRRGVPIGFRPDPIKRARALGVPVTALLD